MSFLGNSSAVKGVVLGGVIAALLFLCSWPAWSQATPAQAKPAQMNPAQSGSDQQASLMLRLDRLQAVRDVQNLMSRYTYYQSAAMQDETLALFAQHTPGTRAEMLWGVYDGLDSVKKCYKLDHLQHSDLKKRAGVMQIDTLTTPIIQVAGDGKTAEGVWMSPGLDSTVVDGKPSAKWAWTKYGADFVKEDGVWKIWHLHIYGIFLTDYHKSWADGPQLKYDASYGGLIGHQMHNDRPPTSSWAFSADTVFPDDQPSIPQPYQTFDEKTAY
jgi:hypothetical protein